MTCGRCRLPPKPHGHSRPGGEQERLRQTGKRTPSFDSPGSPQIHQSSPCWGRETARGGRQGSHGQLAPRTPRGLRGSRRPRATVSGRVPGCRAVGDRRHRCAPTLHPSWRPSRGRSGPQRAPAGTRGGEGGKATLLDLVFRSRNKNCIYAPGEQLIFLIAHPAAHGSTASGGERLLVPETVNRRERPSGAGNPLPPTSPPGLPPASCPCFSPVTCSSRHRVSSVSACPVPTASWRAPRGESCLCPGPLPAPLLSAGAELGPSPHIPKGDAHCE